jgi:hypothetical protein
LLKRIINDLNDVNGRCALMAVLAKHNVQPLLFDDWFANYTSHLTTGKGPICIFRIIMIAQGDAGQPALPPSLMDATPLFWEKQRHWPAEHAE